MVIKEMVCSGKRTKLKIDLEKDLKSRGLKMSEILSLTTLSPVMTKLTQKNEKQV
jgi:hypothetical protein